MYILCIVLRTDVSPESRIIFIYTRRTHNIIMCKLVQHLSRGEGTVRTIILLRSLLYRCVGTRAHVMHNIGFKNSNWLISHLTSPWKVRKITTATKRNFNIKYFVFWLDFSVSRARFFFLFLLLLIKRFVCRARFIKRFELFNVQKRKKERKIV